MFRLTPYRKTEDEIRSEEILDRFFNDFFNGDLGSRFSNQEQGMCSFKVDVVDLGNRYEMLADLPGYKKDEVNIEYVNKHLIISAAKEESDIERNYIIRERNLYEVKRSFYIESIDSNKIEASFSDGVLKITLYKKHEKEESKKIQIK